MASILDPIPNSPFYSPQSYSISTPSGSLVLGSGLAVTSQGIIVSASALGGTVTSVTAGPGLSTNGATSGGSITTSGTLYLLPPQGSSLGGVKAGANVTIASDGTISVAPPGLGTITGVLTGLGMTGGGLNGTVTVSTVPATTSTFGTVMVGSGINVTGGLISLAPASTSASGGVVLATPAEVIAGTNTAKAVTPQGLASKVASTSVPGIVQLSDSVATNNSTVAATQTAAKTAYDAALAAQATADAALPLAGGTMSGVITFAPGQTFPGVAFPVATTSSLGVVQIGTGLNIGPGGILSNALSGTVFAIVPGEGLGAPATLNPITTSGTIKLLPPTIDGLQIGGVKAGDNVTIASDGTISVAGALLTNNPYAFNSYIWPIPKAAPALPCPGATGQVLTIADNVSGQLAWTNTGTLNSVIAGTGIAVTSTATTATVSLATVPSITPGDVGGTALIPTLTVNAQGQITSTGLANPFAPFETPSVSAPFVLTLDFAGNNTNWAWTTNGNTTIQNPLNAVSGQTGALLITQDPLVTYTITWGSSWKFANFSPFTGAGLAEVTLLKFTVVDTNYIVVDTIVTSIG